MKTCLKLKNALLTLLLVTLSGAAEGATITNAISGAWNLTSTWVGGVVPALTDDVVIVTNTTVTITSSKLNQAGVITIQAGGTLSDGGNTLTVNNNLNPGLIVNGTLRVEGALNKGGGGRNPTVRVNSGGIINFSTTTAATGITSWNVQPSSTILYSANGNQTIDRDITAYANITLSGAGAKSLGANISVTGTFSLQGSATFLLNGRTLTYGPNAFLEYKGSAAQTTKVDEFPVTMSAAVVIDNPSGVISDTIRTLNNNLTLSRGTLTLSSALTLGNGVTVTRATGSLSAAPTFGTTVNLLYTGTTGVTAGPEMPASTTVLNNLTVNYSSAATLTLNAARTVNGLLTIGNNSTVAVGSFVLTAKGNVANSGTQSGAGKLLLAGTTSQTLSGAGLYNNLEVSNSSGVALADTPTIQGALTLTAGLISAQTNPLNLTSGATVTRTAGWVNGRVQKAFAIGNNQAFTFPIGGPNNYRPIALSNLQVTATGTLLASVTTINGNHPQLATSGLDPSKMVARYHTLTAGNGLVVSSSDATLRFIAADITGGADPQYFAVRSWNGSTWSQLAVATRSATNISVTGMTSWGDLVIGEPLPSQMLATFPGQTFVSGTGNTGVASNQVAGISFNVTLTYVDRFTNLVSKVSGLKTIAYSGPQNAPNGSPALYQSDVTFTNGQAIGLPLTLTRAETTQLTATDSQVTGVPSSPVAVQAGAVSASESTLVASPTSLAADGVALSTNAVTLTDAYRNPVSGKTVTLASSRGTSDQISAASGVSDVSGIVTFTVKSTVAGTATLTATDTSDALALTQTANVTFLPVALDHFAISPAPISGIYIAGTLITNITLTAQDVNNNTVSGFSGTVTFGGTAGVVGNSASFVDGVCTDVSITPVKAGNDLTFTVVNALGKTGSTTISTIQAAALEHYFIDFVRPVYAGVPFTVTVYAHDAYENLTTNGLAGREATLTTTKGVHTFTPNPITAWTNGQGSAVNSFNNESTNLTISASDGTISGTSASFDVIAQTGSYRTRGSGEWSGTTTWEAYSGSTWVTTNLPPTAGCPSVLIKANHDITVSTTPSEALGKAHIDGTLIIATSATLTLAGQMDVHNLLHNQGTFNIASTGELLVQMPGTLLIDAENNVTPSGSIVYPVQGLFLNAGSFTNDGTIVFAPNSRYRHAVTNASVAIPQATWGHGASCEITGLTGVDGTPAGLAQRFEHLIWNCTNQTTGINLGSNFTNLITFMIAHTGTGRLRLGADVTVSNLTVATGGGLSCGTNVVRGGSFTIESNARLGIGSPDGITTNSAAGNIQTAARSFAAGAHFCYDGTAAQVTGDALPLQVGYLSVTNSAGVSLTRDVNVAYVLELQRGSLTIGAHSLTVRGVFTATGGFLTGGNTSSLAILDYNAPPAATLPGITNGLQHLTIDRAAGVTFGGPVTIRETITLQNGVLGGLANLTLADGCLLIRDHGSLQGPPWPTPQGLINVELRAGDLTAGIAFPPALGSVISNATIANVSGTISLAYNFSIKGDLTLNAGSRLDDSGKTVTVRGNLINNGAYVSSGRLVLAEGHAQHIISGNGTFDRLELDDILGATLQDPITILRELTLASGTLANSTNVTLGSGATILRATGALDGSPTFSGPIHVDYTGTNGVTAGYELPSATNLLQDLMLNYSSPATLTLNGSRQVNGDLTISTNSTLADAGYTLTVVGNIHNHGAATGSGKIALNNPYSQVIIGSGSYSNVELVQGEVDVEGDITINGTLSSVAGWLKVLNHTLTLNGPLIQGPTNALQTTLDSGLVFGGSASDVQVPSSVTQLKNLTVNNPNGLTLQGDLRIEGCLSLLQGVLNAGVSQVQLNNPANDSTALVRNSGWLNGSLLKYFTAGSGQSFTFPLGSALVYRPVVLSAADILEGGLLQFNSLEGIPANMEGSGLDTNRVVGAYWRGTAMGEFLMINAACAFHYVTGDIPAGADLTRFRVRAFASAANSWLDITVGSRGTNVTQGIDIYTMAIPAVDRYEYGDFVVGESQATQLLVTLPGQVYTNTVEQGSGNSGTSVPQVAGSPFDLELRAVDEFGAVDRTYAGEKTISYSGPSNGPNGTAPTYTTTATFANGTATTLATTLKKAETTTITATDGLLTGVASSPLTVTSGDSSRLVFMPPPFTVTAGFAYGGLTVERQDAFGNPVTTNQAITLTLSSTSTGTATFTPNPAQILQGSSQSSLIYWDDAVGSPWLRAQSAGLMDATQQVSVVAPSTLIWDGGGADNQVLTIGNWQESLLPREGDILAFAGDTRLTVTNDLVSFTALSGVNFLTNAAPFVLTGNPLMLAGPLSNQSTEEQTIELEMELARDITVDVVTNGVLDWSGLIAGAYSLTLTNQGTLLLTGVNTYAGGTIVQGGVLTVNNTAGSGTGSGAVTVGASGTLGGNGSISGATTLGAGSVLAPGETSGTLTFGDNLVLQSGSRYDALLGFSTNQVVVVTGTADLSGSTLTVTGDSPSANTYTLLRAGTLSGTFAGLPDGTLITVGPGLFYRIHYRSNEVILVRSQGPTLFSFF
jgi:fibronectin-binding autotransporter adhesin